MADSRRAIIGPVRLSYCYVAEPRPNDREVMEYSTQILVEVKDKTTRKKLQKIVAEAAKKKFGAKAEKLVKMVNFKKPLRNPEEEEGRDGAEYQGMLFCNAKTQAKRGRVGIVLRDGTKLQDLDEISEAIYSGVWAKVSVTAFGFDDSGNKGVALALNNIMKWKDGDRLDGSVDAEDEFADEFEEGGDDDEGDDWGDDDEL